ncbi:MAG TPA: endonuclease, partial [Intrasporangiaceae bacterium]|nr:endonuclease [Intrasporangiaceae bacterium]
AGRASAGGAVVFTALLFAFYAGYDLGYRADLLIPVVALGVAALALAAARTTAPTTAPDPAPSRSALVTTAGVAVVAAALAAIGPSATARPDPRTGDNGTSATVAAWNLRMGYGIDGTFRPDEVAALLRAEGADIVLLSEIDRGWLLNGGQDQLAVLARLLDMEAVFSPAADQVWGDAILSAHPLSDVRAKALPAYRSLTGAGVLAATVTLPAGPVRVISTHLQPDADGPDPTLSQAEDLAAMMTAEAGSGLPVVMGGDLNTVPDSPAWAALIDTGFVDALAPARPLLTSSSDDLTSEIDHILVTADLTTSRPRTVPSLLSDHLPVLVDLDR